MLLRKKKGQMQMMETIGVLFIFFILVVFGMIFYFKYQQISFQEKQEELVATRAMDSTLIALFLPELQCSRSGAEAEDNCIDISKLEGLNSVMSKYSNEYYFNIFSYSRIYVEMVYPTNYNWVVYDHEKTKINDAGDEVPDWEFKEPTFFVVTLRDEMNFFGDLTGHDSTYGFGYLVVEVYS